MLRIKLKELREQHNLSQYDLAAKLGIKQSTIGMWENGTNNPRQATLLKLADFFNVSVDYLLGKTDIPNPGQGFKFLEPTVTDKYSAIPVIGEIAAGYEHIAFENWEGETVDIPDSYLIGHDKSDFFVLKVVGDSMFPEYRDGDKVLILRQSTLNYSGQVGAIIYDNECATLKKVEYNYGEDWLKLVPINANHPTVKIENEDLEQCHILGVPRYLVREITD